MTTEDDFQNALDANPDDWQTRLVFADWLDERGDPRGKGYRALARLRFSPCHLRPVPGEPQYDHWMFQLLPVHPSVLSRREYTFDANDPGEIAWFRKFCSGVFGSHHETRREAEDTAARAFAKLPAKRRRKLLRNLPEHTTR